MVYLKVAHADDNDADYFKFDNVLDAATYITINGEEEWVMSDIPFEEMPLQDYTHVTA